jgi:anti-anti-sigma regulatory factor
MSAIRLGPERIEVAVQAWDVIRSDGQVFLRKFHQALKDAPKNLVIHLSTGPEIGVCGLALLGWARRTAEMQGIRFHLRPATEALQKVLQSGGLADALKAAA